MSVEVVLDRPDRHLGRLLSRTLREFAGGALMLVGLLASVAALPTSFFVIGIVVEFFAGDDSSEPWPPEGIPVAPLVLVWAVSSALALVGLIWGLRLLRSERGMVLFLRRFGYDDATRVVTFAATETIGGAWRLVTLDDAEIAPVGVDTSTRLAVRVIRVAWAFAMRAGRFVAFQVFPVSVTGLWIIIGIELLRADDWKRFLEGPRDRYIELFGAFMELRLPFDAIEVSLPGAFAALGIVATLSFLALMVVFAALLLAFPFAAILFFVSMSGDAVLEAERAKTSAIETEPDLERAAAAIQLARRRVFAPRLLVVRVANAYWQRTVVRLGTIATAVLIDVSEPTENLLWELERMNVRIDDRCVLIGQHERVAGLATDAAATGSPAPDSIEARLRALLDGRRVLAYTTDRRGMQRFARALRSELLTLSRDGAVFGAVAPSDASPSPAT